jgi:hypothetical protein
VVGEAEEHEGHRVPKEADGEHRLPSDAVARRAPQRRKDKLHRRVARGQQADLEGRGADAARVELQHGQHDAKPHHHDEDGKEEDEQTAAADAFMHPPIIY